MTASFATRKKASADFISRKLDSALLNYKELHGTFPPAFICDPTGHPINSWRTEVVPYFWYNFRPGRDDYAGGPGYDYSEPWNGPNNAKLHLDQKPCDVFQCPSDHPPAAATTNYVAIVGPNTLWPGAAELPPLPMAQTTKKFLCSSFPAQTFSGWNRAIFLSIKRSTLSNPRKTAAVAPAQSISSQSSAQSAHSIPTSTKNRCANYWKETSPSPIINGCHAHGSAWACKPPHNIGKASFTRRTP